MVTFSTSDSKLTSSANYNHSAKIPPTKPLAMGILSNSATLAKEGAARTAASQTLNNRQLLPLLQCKTTRKYNHSSNNYIYDTSNKDGRIIDETNLMIIENANIPLVTYSIVDCAAIVAFVQTMEGKRINLLAHFEECTKELIIHIQNELKKKTADKIHQLFFVLLGCSATSSAEFEMLKKYFPKDSLKEAVRIPDDEYCWEVIVKGNEVIYGNDILKETRPINS